MVSASAIGTLFSLPLEIREISASAIGTLFSLPLEIREIIYGYLTPPSRLPTILRSRHLGVSSVSHRPPPLDLLLSCRQLYVEALDVYYRKCVFKLDGLLDPANVWPLWQIEEVLGGSELGKVTLGNMRKIELNLFWHRFLDGGVTSAAMANVGGQYGNLCNSESEKRMERLGRAVRVLRSASQLKQVILTWKEIPAREGEQNDDWTIKEKILSMLGALDGSKIVAGDIVASNEVETAILALIQNLNQSLPGQSLTTKSTIPTEWPRQYMELVEATQHSLKATEDKSMSYFE